MPENRVEFTYIRRDVISAQRMRFLRSNQLKVILLIWLGSVLFLSAPLVLPQWFKPGPYTSWALVVQISLAYLVTLVVITFITPWFDFYINRFWRLPLLFQFSEKQVRLSVTGKPGGLRLKWSQVIRVDENDRVFILHYGSGGKYVILPKRAFGSPGDERRFRDLLTRRALLSAAETNVEEEQEAEAQEK